MLDYSRQSFIHSPNTDSLPGVQELPCSRRNGEPHTEKNYMDPVHDLANGPDTHATVFYFDHICC